MIQTYVGTANIGGLDYFVNEVVAQDEKMLNFLRLRAESTGHKHGVFYRLKLDEDLAPKIRAIALLDRDCRKALKMLTEQCKDLQIIVGTEKDMAAIKKCLE